MNNSTRKEIVNAYADCTLPWEEAVHIRNLDFRSDVWLDKYDAQEVLEEALGGPDGGYNNFYPELVNKFPDDAEFQIAREGSVCLYVKRGEQKLPTARKVKADEVDGEEIVRYWWD